MDKDLYYELILDKYLEESNLTDEETKLLEEAEKYFIEKSKLNMGIGMMCAGYVFANENQDIWEEYSKITQFLQKYLDKYASSKGKSVQDFRLEFINYGRTQIVYVLEDKTSGEKVTILAKQPIVEYGKVKQEMENLKRLSLVDGSVIAPIDYFCDGEQELYVTPYINQARCVASDEKWGMYIPEPFYRFENFSDEQAQVVNICMIAKLVSLYDFEKEQGLFCCKLGGGDFMLPKGWELEKPSVENTFDRLYLIAARDIFECSFEDYLDIIRSEFSRVTINENQGNLLINIRGRVAMDLSHIEQGIELGKYILAKRKDNNEKQNL